MNYGEFTQGSVLHGLRSNRYPDKKCSGVVITARCDIAQCKVSKFYYLTAMDIKTWVDSEGLLFAAERKLINQFKKVIDDFGERIPGLKSYQNASSVDLEKIIADISSLPEDQTESVLKRLNDIKQFTTEDCERLRKISEVKKYAQKQLLNDIFDDKITAYSFIPQIAYKEKADCPHDGLIVNLLDINSFDLSIVRIIEQQNMDFDKLSVEQRNLYGQLFFLENPGDMVFPEEVIKPPFLEHLMQAFSFAFIRIGTNFNRQAAKNYWDNQFKKDMQAGE